MNRNSITGQPISPIPADNLLRKLTVERLDHGQTSSEIRPRLRRAPTTCSNSPSALSLWELARRFEQSLHGVGHPSRHQQHRCRCRPGEAVARNQVRDDGAAQIEEQSAQTPTPSSVASVNQTPTRRRRAACRCPIPRPNNWDNWRELCVTITGFF